MKESYTCFRDSVSAPRFAGALITPVCPYCDKAFLDVTKKFYGELDHYLDKSTYSYYALNIYNFVPVCAICNKKKSKKTGAFPSCG
jgi:5-methylcytosine-specific restriction endonuclease McrA